MTNFERVLLKEIAMAKETLRQDESLSGFTLTITASGRMDGDCEVKFAIGGLYGEKSVEAGALAPALAEFLRRRGWTARHEPLCLPNVETPQGTPVNEL